MSTSHAINRINFLIEKVTKFLNEASEKELSFKPSPGKWSQIEIIGHLCDSAINNLSRFIRAQHEPKPFAVIGYDQDAWVAAAHYQDMSVDEVLGFWQSANRNIVTVISFYTPEMLKYECFMEGGDFGNYTKEEIPEYTGSSGMRTLRWLIDDYAAHMEYHLKQIPGVISEL